MAVVLAAAAAACKPMAGRDAKAPEPPVTSIDDAEARLAENARRLEDAGIALPAATAKRATSIDASAEDGGGDGEAPMDEGADEEVADDAGGAVAPAADVAEQETRAFDDADAGPGAPAAGVAAPQRSRCERVCDLAASTCDLAQRVCDLANDHEDEDRYVQACTRAEEQCEAASDACAGCED